MTALHGPNTDTLRFHRLRTPSRHTAECRKTTTKRIMKQKLLEKVKNEQAKKDNDTIIMTSIIY